MAYPDSESASDSGIRALLESVPLPCYVLDANRRIVACNEHGCGLAGAGDVCAIAGRRIGEIVGCVNSTTGPDGCGSSPACCLCGAFQSMTGCLKSHAPCTAECRILAQRDHSVEAYDLKVRSSFVTLEGREYVIVALKDISAEKRRLLLERIFFHDVLNTAGGIRGLAGFVANEDDPDLMREDSQEIVHLSDQMIEEIQAQRQILAAERSELKLDVKPAAVDEAIRTVVNLYAHHELAEGRNIAVSSVSDLVLCTDALLLRRILGNLLKNALEAVPEGATVTVEARRAEDGVEIVVANPGFIETDVQLQIFQRSFSTKGGSGRGIGTYSAKLLTEKYLGGRLSFTSDTSRGTRFIVQLPSLKP